MEPLTTAAIAIGSVVATKALEKTGEKIGETLYDTTGQFLKALKQESPQTATALANAPQAPLDYGVATLEVEAAAKKNPEVARAVQELVEAARAESNQKLAQVLAMPNIQKMAEKIRQVVKSKVDFNRNIKGHLHSSASLKPF
jgi:ubiquinone biosynthesis protein COQ9